MKRTTRKEALSERGLAYGRAHRYEDTGLAFEAGYRAAMRDMRKGAGTDGELDYTRLLRILHFMRPLR